VAGKTLQEIHCGALVVEDLKIYLASTRKGGLRIELTLGRHSDTIAFFKNLFPHARLRKDASVLRPLKEGVEAALFNRRPKKPLDLDCVFTPFQRLVFNAIATIPFGERRTYGEVGRMVGRPGSARAVGQALNKNPLPLIFP
jgi:O6-methylguanine-DNA--protein-cysteine methyltransferase